MIPKRRACLAIALSLSLPARGVHAQQPRKMARVGVVSPGSLPLGPLEAFRQELRELDHVEGRNLVLEWRFADGSNERLVPLMEELVRRNVDVILAINTQTAQIAKKATVSIPVVFVRVTNPLHSGLVASLSRPGGNITGVSNVADELRGKRYEMLKAVLPKASRVAVLRNPGNPGSGIDAHDWDRISARLQLRLQSVGFRGETDLRAAFEAVRAMRPDVLYVADDLLITRFKREILDFAADTRLPVVSLYEEFVEAGGLMCYGPNIPAMYRRAARHVDKILRGAKPGELPVEQPTDFELVINLKTAKQLGITIAPDVLARANKVYR